MKNKWLLLLVVVILFVCTHAAHAQIITTIAGGGSDINDDSLATHASLDNPIGIAIDKKGYLYIGDRDNNRVRKVSTAGIITTIAGTGSGSYGGDGGPATAAKISGPYGIAVDRSGNVYIADGFNYRIRKVDNSGIISTIAGTGTAGYNGDGIAATTAEIGASGVAVDANGNVYIADISNNRIRKIDTSGIITTIAGTGTPVNSGDGGAATLAGLDDPYGIAVDGSENIYIAEDHGNSVRKISAAGIITTIAGTGVAGYSGDGAAATAAQLDRSCGVGVDGLGNVYIADVNNSCVRMVNASGIISTIAGTGTLGFAGDGGLAVSAELSAPVSVIFDGNNNIYISDFGNDRIREIKNTVGVTAIKSIVDNIAVYPNPNNGTFTVNVSSAINEAVEIIITNVLGEKIKEITANTNTPLTITIGSPPGIYILSTAIKADIISKRIDVDHCCSLINVQAIH